MRPLPRQRLRLRSPQRPRQPRAARLPSRGLGCRRHVAQAAGVTPKRVAPFFDIEMLPAQHGDSLWIEYGDASATHRWLVDCGTAPTAAELRRRVELLPKKDRRFELLVLSHIDADHIGGVLPFLNEVKKGMRFGDVWFNGWRHLSGQLGAKQGEMFSSALQDLNLPWNQWRQGQAIVVEGGDLPEHTLPGGMKLTLLSPRREQLAKLAPAWARELKKAGLVPGAHVDYSSFLRGTPSTSTDVDKLADTPFAGDAAAPNGSSIALLAEFGGASALLGADAHAPVVVESVRKLLRQRGVDRLRLDALQSVASRQSEQCEHRAPAAPRLQDLWRVDEWRSLLSSRSRGDSAHHQVRRQASGTPFQLPDALQRRVGATRPAGAVRLHCDLPQGRSAEHLRRVASRRRECVTKVFISYRRDDASANAGRLCDWLQRQFKDDNVFLDTEKIAPGDDFPRSCKSGSPRPTCCSLSSARHGRASPTPPATGASAQPKDFVALEVGTALERGIRIIPVLVGGASMPKADQLPPRPRGNSWTAMPLRSTTAVSARTSTIWSMRSWGGRAASRGASSIGCSAACAS